MHPTDDKRTCLHDISSGPTPAPKNKPQLPIVIPAYNEEANISELYEHLMKVLPISKMVHVPAPISSVGVTTVNLVTSSTTFRCIQLSIFRAMLDAVKAPSRFSL